MDKSPHFSLQSAQLKPVPVEASQTEGGHSPAAESTTQAAFSPGIPADTHDDQVTYPRDTNPDNADSPQPPPQDTPVVGPRVAILDEDVESRPATVAPKPLAVNFPPEHEAAADAVESLLRVTHRLRSVLGPHFAEFELSEIRFVVLRMIRDAENGCSQRDVADHLMQSESSISTLIERMRRDGLIYRLTSATDRRRKTLMLSERGRALLTSAEQPHAHRMHLLLHSLSSDERQSLCDLLRRVDVDVTACAETPPWTSKTDTGSSTQSESTAA